jgi:hypothetical protein
MSVNRKILIGCGTLLLAGVMLAGLGIAWVLHVSEDIEDASVVVRVPLDVQVGETFRLEVAVRNERNADVLTVADVDIGDSYLSGFTVVATDPLYHSAMQVPLLDTWSHTFDLPIAASTTATFIFTLRAERAGIFRGDVDVYEGSQLTTTIAQTVVKQERQE